MNDRPVETESVFGRHAATELSVAYAILVPQRQARRYVDAAAASGRVPVPEATVVFTVKVPARLAAAVREHARVSGRTISAVVAQALEEFLARSRREHPRR